jgi:hypothetical protein
VGLLDRWRGREGGGDPDEPEEARTPAEDADAEPVEEVQVRRLATAEEAALEDARTHYTEHAIDPADLGSIAAAYDRAVGTLEGAAASEAVTVVATAVGDHLVTHGYRWVVSTDPFGTDLAVEPPRRGVPVVVRTLVAVRWMQRESGWVTGVVEHLARAGRR